MISGILAGMGFIVLKAAESLFAERGYKDTSDASARKVGWSHHLSVFRTAQARLHIAGKSCVLLFAHSPSIN
jgi:hypothetical protein